MHRLLRRLLKKSGLSVDTLPDEKAWKKFIENIDNIFQNNDEDRYLLERSLELTSQEMQEILEASRETYQLRIQALIHAIPDLIFYVNEEGRYLDVLSHGPEEMLYLPKKEIIGRTNEEIFSSTYAKLFFDTIKRAIAENRLQVIEYTMDFNGEQRYYEARVMPTELVEDGFRTAVVIVRDITVQKRSTEYLGVIKKIFEEATEGILILYKNGAYVEANGAFCRMLGLEEGCRPALKEEFLQGYIHADKAKIIMEKVKSEGTFRGEVVLRRMDGEKLLVWLTVDTVKNEKEEPTHQVVMMTDLSEIQRSREKLRYAATHDSLTGLPNRTLLFERLEEAVKRTKRSGSKGALLFIDLDNFKEINDTCGHKAGDMVLTESVRRIRSVLRSSDILGRLGGDEFLLIVENIESVDTPTHVAEKIIKVINEPFDIEGEQHSVGSSIGIAIFPDDSENQDELIQFADMAMYQAKQSGKNRFHYYSTARNESVRRQYDIEKAIGRALECNCFTLLYQPQIDLKSGKVVGLEALLRIDASLIGPISPMEFMPVAEESELAVKIGRWVFKKVCRQLAEWEREGMKGMKVAVNFTRRQLIDENFIHFAIETVKEYGIDPKQLEIEVTEATYMYFLEHDHDHVEALRKEGFRLSIDDFGTGYSSLSNLKNLILEKLKIDQSFIDNILTDESERAIVYAAVALAHALGLRVVAEGVEKEAQKELLEKIGCDEIQGYFFSHPCKPEEITKFLKK